MKTLEGTTLAAHTSPSAQTGLQACIRACTTPPRGVVNNGTCTGVHKHGCRNVWVANKRKTVDYLTRAHSDDRDRLGSWGPGLLQCHCGRSNLRQLFDQVQHRRRAGFKQCLWLLSLCQACRNGHATRRDTRSKVTRGQRQHAVKSNTRSKATRGQRQHAVKGKHTLTIVHKAPPTPHSRPRGVEPVRGVEAWCAGDTASADRCRSSCLRALFWPPALEGPLGGPLGEAFGVKPSETLRKPPGSCWGRAARATLTRSSRNSRPCGNSMGMVAMPLHTTRQCGQLVKSGVNQQVRSTGAVNMNAQYAAQQAWQS